jgi:hypothetical protein
MIFFVTSHIISRIFFAARGTILKKISIRKSLIKNLDGGFAIYELSKPLTNKVAELLVHADNISASRL